jgi:hypothetical protein
MHGLRFDLATKTTRELIQIATGGAISWPNPPGSIAVNVIGRNGPIGTEDDCPR